MSKSKTFGLMAMAFAGLVLAAEPVMAGAPAPVPSPQTQQREELGNAPQTTDARERRGRRRADRSAPPTDAREGAVATLAAAGIACEPTEAVNPGRVPTGQVYEVACSTGPGYLLIASTPPTAVDCLELAGTAAIARERDPAADVGLQCSLPANDNGLAVISGWAREAGVTCTVDQVQATGKRDTTMIYEVGCAGVDGYWIERSATGWTARDCFEVLSGNGVCRFTTPAEQNATLQAKLAGTDAAACNVTQAKLMGHNANGRFYEVKCAAEGEGYIARINAEGVTQQIYPCAIAQPIGGGCTLTPVPAAAPAPAATPGGRA